MKLIDGAFLDSGMGSNADTLKCSQFSVEKTGVTVHHRWIQRGVREQRHCGPRLWQPVILDL